MLNVLVWPLGAIIYIARVVWQEARFDPELWLLSEWSGHVYSWLSGFLPPPYNHLYKVFHNLAVCEDFWLERIKMKAAVCVWDNLVNNRTEQFQRTIKRKKKAGRAKKKTHKEASSSYVFIPFRCKAETLGYSVSVGGNSFHHSRARRLEQKALASPECSDLKKELSRATTFGECVEIVCATVKQVKWIRSLWDLVMRRQEFRKSCREVT